MIAAMIVLASSSPYRRELLARLGLTFRIFAPSVDESPLASEPPSDLALRLAREKALAVRRNIAAQALEAVVIGSDQVATLDGRAPIGKPGTHERAREQLAAASGRTMTFHTAVCVLASGDDTPLTACVDTRVRFRTLQPVTIERYLRAERPYDCAGAAKSEGLGISLLESIEGTDPTALIGLPLITLCDLLARAGITVPGEPGQVDA